MADTVRWVVVGYGMGAYHARLIREVEGLELWGVSDLDASRRTRAQQDFPGIRTYTTYEEVLNDRHADGVVIVTPHNLHAEMAIAAMNAGKHAITDKAMCLSVEEARAMFTARDKNGVLLSTFQNRRWDSDFLTVQAILHEGWLGKLYHIQSCVTSYGHIGGWRAKREWMGGWLYDWGAHTLDQILQLECSRPLHVYAFAHARSDEMDAVEDYIHCTVTFESGLTATTVIGFLNKIEMPRWYIFGEDGTLQADDFQKPIRVKTKLKSIDTELSVPLIKGDWKDYYVNIAEVLRDKAELIVKPEQLVPQIAIAEAAYRSIEKKQVVHVEY